MKDKKDMSERLKYFNKQHTQQQDRKGFYTKQLAEIKQLLEKNEHEVRYNEGWIKFHDNVAKEHQSQIDESVDLDKTIDQKQKLQFHINQIEEHHVKNLIYHNNEIAALKKEILLFKEGIDRCESQIKFLKDKIKENSV